MLKILFTGGGTLGPVTPLLAVIEEIRCSASGGSGVSIVWIGTRRGPERELVKAAGIKFSWIYAPKWRRYFDARNFFVPLLLHLATKMAWFKLLKIRPAVIVTAGGFVGVPVVWAAWWLKMWGIRIPTILHNQDVRWSLANRLVAPFVEKITYVLPGTVPRRWQKKAVWTGNPVRRFILEGKAEPGLKRCGFSKGLSTIMVIGGGTGAQCLNEIVWEALPELTKKYQVIHITGRGKHNPSQPPLTLRGGDDSITPLKVRGDGGVMSRYSVFEFVTHEIADLYAAANIVITRAGMGVLTELAVLQKPMIIVPIPESHQEDNARYFAEKKAAVILDQRKLGTKQLIETLERMFRDLGDTQEMTERAYELSGSDAAGKVAREILKLVNKKYG